MSILVAPLLQHPLIFFQDNTLNLHQVINLTLHCATKQLTARKPIQEAITHIDKKGSHKCRVDSVIPNPAKCSEVTVEQEMMK